jgi:biopolymer transport protein ExbD
MNTAGRRNQLYSGIVPGTLKRYSGECFLSRAFQENTQRRKPNINVTPLIDILLLLLIFFMVSSTFKQDQLAIDVSLPEAGTGNTTSMEYREIVVGKDGELYFEGVEIQKEDLNQTLTDIKKSAADTPLILRADKEANFGDVVWVFDAAKEVGITNLVVPTAPLPEAQEQ